MTSGPDIASVEFWFDPACPFTWRTSRWLVDVAGRRRIAVQWRLMSLSILNEGRDVPEQYREGMRQSRRALRVLAAAQQASGSGAVGRLYTVVGGHKHEQGEVYDDEMLRTGVAEAELPAELAAAADEQKWDAAVRTSHDEAQQRVGTEAGSPIIALDGGRAYFGPVVVPPPTGDQADRLFDALRLLSSVPAFSELKRARAPI